MANSELGTKRVCPETGRKFYDLNKDPIVSPYTGHSYPRDYFESGSKSSREKDEEPVEEVEEREGDETDDEDNVETVSLEEADEEAKGDAPVSTDDDDVDLGDDDEDNDSFIEEDEEEDDDVKEYIGDVDDEEDQ